MEDRHITSWRIAQAMKAAEHQGWDVHGTFALPADPVIGSPTYVWCLMSRVKNEGTPTAFLEWRVAPHYGVNPREFGSALCYTNDGARAFEVWREVCAKAWGLVEDELHV